MRHLHPVTSKRHTKPSVLVRTHRPCSAGMSPAPVTTFRTSSEVWPLSPPSASQYLLLKGMVL